jgi:hypothetical protein
MSPVHVDLFVLERVRRRPRHHVKRRLGHVCVRVVGLCTYEGSLSFVTVIYFYIGIIHTNENGGGTMTEDTRLSRAVLKR